LTLPNGHVLHTQQQCSLSAGARAMAGGAPPAAPHASSDKAQLSTCSLPTSIGADQANELVQGQIVKIYLAGQGTE
jgi:hypothetical protein